MPKEKDKNVQIIKNFIHGKKILIVDTNSSVRNCMSQSMIDLGASQNQISTSSNYDSASKLLKEKKIEIIVTDYDLNQRSGLELIPVHKEVCPDPKNRLFILVTGNSTENAVAEAAEEEVDTYILKPFNTDILLHYFSRAILSKVNPGPYKEAIENGKHLIETKEFEKALEAFNQAKKLTEKPALACYYSGVVFDEEKNVNEAESNFLEGIQHINMHYKCLIGLFDVQFKTGRHQEAYETIIKLAEHFPINPQRLGDILQLAIKTENYSDIDFFYDIYLGLEHKSEKLIRTVSAALVVAGKFHLQRGEPIDAVRCFQRAITTAGRRTPILREVISSLVRHDFHDEASLFLKEFPPESRAGKDFLAMEVLLQDRDDSAALAIQMARKLITKKIFDPQVYEILIRRSLEKGFEDSATSHAQDAANRWPELKDRFLALVQVK